MVEETQSQYCPFTFEPEINSLYQEKVIEPKQSFLNTEITKEIMIQVVAGLVIICILYMITKRVR